MNQAKIEYDNYLADLNKVGKNGNEFVNIDGYECFIARHTNLQTLCGYIVVKSGKKELAKQITGHEITFVADYDFGKGPVLLFGVDFAGAGQFTPSIATIFEDGTVSYPFIGTETYKNYDYVVSVLKDIAGQLKALEGDK